MLGKNSINLWKVKIVPLRMPINDAYFFLKKAHTVPGFIA